MLYNNIRPSYHLKRWRYYEAARHELGSFELDNAKLFFAAMKRLNKEDRKILADIYYYSKRSCSFNPKTGYYQVVLPIPDSDLHGKYGVTLDGFAKMKREAHINLKQAMQEVLEQMGNNFIFKLNDRLYLSKVLYKGTHQESYVLGGHSQAMTYEKSKQNEEWFIKLILMGFEKIPITERENPA